MPTAPGYKFEGHRSWPVFRPELTLILTPLPRLLPLGAGSSCRSRNAVHPILLSPKPCANGDKTGSPNGTRSLANASNRSIGSRKNFSPSTNLIAILRQRVGKLARVQARVSKRVGATTPICGNPNSIALGEIRFVGRRQGGGSEKGGEQHQQRCCTNRWCPQLGTADHGCVQRDRHFFSVGRNDGQILCA